MKVMDLEKAICDTTPVTLLTYNGYTVLAKDQKGLKKFADEEIIHLTAGTRNGKFGREGVICAFVSDACAGGIEQ